MSIFTLLYLISLAIGFRVGQRYYDADENKIYLYYDGKCHWIPNSRTFWHLFRDGNYVPYDGCRIGDPIVNGARLVQFSEEWKVYLLNGNVLRHIGSPNVMDAYNFDWSKILTLPARGNWDKIFIHGSALLS